MKLNQEQIKAFSDNTPKGKTKTAGQGFTRKSDRPPTVQMTTKAELCKILNISVEEFEAQCKKWSIVIDENYVPAQVAAMREHFGVTAKGDRPAAQPAAAVQPTDLNQVAQSEAMTIRESINLSAGTGTRALQALSAQRDSTQQAIAAEIERLTDPELFFTETIAIAAEKIRTREQQRDQVSFELDFFDVASVTASLPAPRQLPPVQMLKSLASAG